MTLTMHNTQYAKLWYFAYAAKEASRAALCHAAMHKRGFKVSMRERNAIHRYNASSAIATARAL